MSTEILLSSQHDEHRVNIPKPLSSCFISQFKPLPPGTLVRKTSPCPPALQLSNPPQGEQKFSMSSLPSALSWGRDSTGVTQALPPQS